MIRSRTAWLLSLVLVIASGAVASGKRAALSPQNPLLGWEGRGFTASSSPDPEACTPETCDEFTFEIKLPRGYWDKRRGGVEVSVRWGSEQDDFELYVYRGGNQVASSTGSFSMAESAFIKRAEPGEYRAVIVPLAVDDSDYDGIVQLEPRRPARTSAPRRPWLPNLRTVALRDFRIVAPVFYATGQPVPYGDQAHFSCYFDETAETGATKCLRFSNGVANVGRGRLTIKMHVSEGDQERNIYQIIQMNDGTRRTRKTRARYEVHTTHGHLHYEGFARYDLYDVDPDTGERLGRASEGTKSGFCLIDVELIWWAQPRNERRHYVFPDCNVPEGTEATYVLGISRGWADIYTWDLPDQYIDITDVPDGVYEVVSRADVAKTLLEETRHDNSAHVYVRIKGDEVKKVRRPGS